VFSDGGSSFDPLNQITSNLSTCRSLFGFLNGEFDKFKLSLNICQMVADVLFFHCNNRTLSSLNDSLQFINTD